MLNGYFDLPTFVFYSQGNVWVGSMYTNFSYKIDVNKPEEGDKTMRLRIWYGTQSVEYVEDFVFTQEFAYSKEGYEELIKVLNDRFEVYKADPSPKPSSLNL